MSSTLQELERQRAKLAKKTAKIEKLIAKEEKKAAKQNSPDWVEINGVRIRIHGGLTRVLERCPPIYVYEYKPVSTPPAISWEAAEPVDTINASEGHGQPPAGGNKLLVTAQINGIDYPSISCSMTYSWEEANKVQLNARNLTITFDYYHHTKTICLAKVSREAQGCDNE